LRLAPLGGWATKKAQINKDKMTNMSLATKRKLAAVPKNETQTIRGLTDAAMPLKTLHTQNILH